MLAEWTIWLCLAIGLINVKTHLQAPGLNEEDPSTGTPHIQCTLLSRTRLFLCALPEGRAASGYRPCSSMQYRRCSAQIGRTKGVVLTPDAAQSAQK